MSLLTNIFEFPSDAFKIVTHFRRPLPHRADTIGPWLDCLSFLAWLSALTNSALLYLFHPKATRTTTSTTATSTSAAATAVSSAGRVEIQRARMQEVLARTLFIALAASHGFILLRAVVRHVLERAMWYGSEEKKRLDAAKLEIKERYIQSIERHRRRDDGTPLDPDSGATAASSGEVATMTTTTTTVPVPVPIPVQVAEKEGQSAETPSEDEFWQFDEGLDEIRKGIKDS